MLIAMLGICSQEELDEEELIEEEVIVEPDEPQLSGAPPILPSPLPHSVHKKLTS